MKKNLFIVLGLLLPTNYAIAQFQVNPQLGMMFTNYTKLPDNVSSSANIGWMLGGDLRFGERFQFQPGVFYVSSATAISSDTGTVVSNDIVQNSFKLKLMAAYNIVDKGAFKIRLNAGPAYDFTLSANNKTLDEKITDDFENGTFFLQGGLGVDFLIFSVEAGYIYGLSKTFSADENDANTTGVYLTAGVVFGSGKKDK